MIKEVYKNTFKEEMEKITKLIEHFPIVSMDIEFPGCVYNKMNSRLASNYEVIKKNIDNLKLIQVGITLSDKLGCYPSETCTWQFNLEFNLKKEIHKEESINLLSSCGLEFDKHCEKGIPHLDFGEMLITSGLILNDESGVNVQWVTFQGEYDFGYLLASVTNSPLPEDEKGFYEELNRYFIEYYDIRFLVGYTDLIQGSLNKLGSDCLLNRVGISHQAGSDSLFTSEIFHKFKNEIFPESKDNVSKYKNILYRYEEDTGITVNANSINVINFTNLTNSSGITGVSRMNIRTTVQSCNAVLNPMEENYVSNQQFYNNPYPNSHNNMFSNTNNTTNDNKKLNNSNIPNNNTNNTNIPNNPNNSSNTNNTNNQNYLYNMYNQLNNNNQQQANHLMNNLLSNNNINTNLNNFYSNTNGYMNTNNSNTK